MEIFKLEQTRALQILMYVAENEQVIIKELMDYVGGSYNTTNRAVGVLVELKLVENYLEVGRPSKRYIRILEKGKKAAKLLKELESILN